MGLFRFFSRNFTIIIPKTQLRGPLLREPFPKSLSSQSWPPLLPTTGQGLLCPPGSAGWCIPSSASEEAPGPPVQTGLSGEGGGRGLLDKGRAVGRVSEMKDQRTRSDPCRKGGEGCFLS